MQRPNEQQQRLSSWAGQELYGVYALGDFVTHWAGLYISSFFFIFIATLAGTQKYSLTRNNLK